MSSFWCSNIQYNDIQLDHSQQTENIAALCITFLVYHELLFSHTEHHHVGAECCSAVSLSADFHHVKVHFVER